ncbi:MAG: hypothetical protein Q7K11_01370 [Candidatus Berkelbacteria bacterium]|nr:hypothetical protein [Candidatus Berkelbacteria bacterium]
MRIAYMLNNGIIFTMKNNYEYNERTTLKEVDDFLFKLKSMDAIILMPAKQLQEKLKELRDSMCKEAHLPLESVMPDDSVLGKDSLALFQNLKSWVRSFNSAQ